MWLFMLLFGPSAWTGLLAQTPEFAGRDGAPED